MKTRIPHAAFSLVEVVIAMGLVTFGLVSVLGLVPVALNSNRQAASDTAMAAMTEFVSSTLLAQHFAAAQANTSELFAFDRDGRFLTNGNASLSVPSAYFTCLVTQAANGATTNALYYKLQFLWPVPAVQAHLTTNSTSISLSNLD